MTDFEKNATSEELEQLERETPDPNRIRQEPGNEGPEKQPGFRQALNRCGARAASYSPSFVRST